MKENKILNMGIVVLLMCVVAITLTPLFLMFKTSLKSEGTLTQSAKQVVVADFEDESGTSMDLISMHADELCSIASGFLKDEDRGNYQQIQFSNKDGKECIWQVKITQDMRKFSNLKLHLKTVTPKLSFRIDLTDALGNSTSLRIDKYIERNKENVWQKVSIPVGEFWLNKINSKLVENLSLVFDKEGTGEVCLDDISLRFKKVTLINYIDVLISGPFGRYFLNSILISIVVTLGNLLFGSMVAYAFARKEFPGKRWMFLLVVGSIMIPPQVLMVPLFILMKNIQWLNTYWALIVPGLVTPFSIFLLRQYISSLPVDLEDAALVDGASQMQILFKVIVPLAKPALAVVGINTFMGSWNSFLYPFLLTNTTQMRTLPVGLALYKSLYSVDWVHLMAASGITAIPVIIVFLCFQKHIIAGLTSGAVKG